MNMFEQIFEQAINDFENSREDGTEIDTSSSVWDNASDREIYEGLSSVKSNRTKVVWNKWSKKIYLVRTDILDEQLANGT